MYVQNQTILVSWIRVETVLCQIVFLASLVYYQKERVTGFNYRENSWKKLECYYTSIVYVDKPFFQTHRYSFTTGWVVVMDTRQGHLLLDMSVMGGDRRMFELEELEVLLEKSYRWQIISRTKINRIVEVQRFNGQSIEQWFTLWCLGKITMIMYCGNKISMRYWAQKFLLGCSR